MLKEKFWEILPHEDGVAVMNFRPPLPFVVEDAVISYGAIELLGESAKISLSIDEDMSFDPSEITHLRVMEFNLDKEECHRDILIELS